jgi:mRNA-degrading endonuclease toxin of MazEF toxin-antitoxin module
MKRGEVWWHEPPDDKRRPVLILTRAEAIVPGAPLDVSRGAPGKSAAPSMPRGLRFPYSVEMTI